MARTEGRGVEVFERLRPVPATKVSGVSSCTYLLIVCKWYVFVTRTHLSHAQHGLPAKIMFHC